MQQGRCRECGGWRLLIHTGPEFSQCLGRGSQHPASQVTAPSTAHCARYTGSTGDTDTGGSGDTQLQIQGIIGDTDTDLYVVTVAVETMYLYCNL